MTSGFDGSTHWQDNPMAQLSAKAGFHKNRVDVLMAR